MTLRPSMTNLFKRIRTHWSTERLRKQDETYLFQVFEKNGCPRNLARRVVHTPNNKTNRGEQWNGRIMHQKYIWINRMTIPTSRSHRSLLNSRRLTTKPKKLLKTGRWTHVIYNVKCMDCDKWYISQIGRKLTTRIYEHELARIRHDPTPFVSVDEQKEEQKFNLDNVEILHQAATRHTRVF